MNSLTPDRKEFVNEHNAGFKGGAWFIVIFVITSIGIGIWIDTCTYNPLKEQKQTTDTTQLKPIKDTLTEDLIWGDIDTNQLKSNMVVEVQTEDGNIIGTIDSVIMIYQTASDSLRFFLVVPDDKDLITWYLNDSIERADSLRRLKIEESLKKSWVTDTCICPDKLDLEKPEI